MADVTDAQIKKIIEHLLGTAESLDTAVSLITDGKFDESNLTLSQHEQIDAEIMTMRNVRTVGKHMELIFLDIDGVLNSKTTFANGYTGVQSMPREYLNYVLSELPEVQIVVSSAWRYAILNGSMTLRGLEHNLLTHGLNVKGRLHGHTEADLTVVTTDDWQLQSVEYWHMQSTIHRSQQIKDYVTLHNPKHFVVVDDVALSFDYVNFAHIAHPEGMQEQDALSIVEKFISARESA